MPYSDTLEAMYGPRIALFESGAGSRLDLRQAVAGLHLDGEAYCCGPLSMLDEIRYQWADSGRQAEKLRFETFGSSGHHPAADFLVRLPRLGKEVRVGAAQSMLAALTAAGVDGLSDCNRGECGLCVLDVLEVDGDIDHRDVFLSTRQKAEGNKICACVSRVRGRALTVEPPWRSDATLIG